MAVLALGAIGSAIGSGFAGIAALGLSGSAIGWTVGTLLGNALFTKGTNTQGPRIGDLKVQASTYGTFIPVVYGTHRLSGNIIFCQGLDEHTHTQKQGKGGGATSTTYSYTTDVAILLCRGEMTGIRKIWNNGKLIYDASIDGSIGSIITSALNASNFVFYPGSQTQLPDPTMEARMGVGNVPAYLGCCYVMFTGLDCPNGQIPQLSFEVVENATVATQKQQFGELIHQVPTLPPGNEGSEVRFGWSSSDSIYYTIADGPPTAARYLTTYRQGAGYTAIVGKYQQPLNGDGNKLLSIMAVNGEEPELAYCVYLGVATQFYAYVQNAATGISTNCGMFIKPTGSGNAYQECARDPISGYYCMLAGDGSDMIRFNNAGATRVTIAGAGRCAAYDGKLYVLISSTTMLVIDIITGSTLATVTRPTFPSGGGGTTYQSIRADATGVYTLLLNDATHTQLAYWDEVSWEILSTDMNLDMSGTITYPEVRQLYANSTYAIYGPARRVSSGVTTDVFQLVQFQNIDPTLRNLADVITQIHEESGFESSQVSTIGITDQLWGFMRTRQTSGRALLDPLLSAYSIDPADNGDVTDYLKREDQIVAATIPYDDLGAVVGDAVSDDPFPFARAQQDELPRSVTTNFVNLNADYETGAEVARRNIVDTQYDDSFEMPIATTADHAATISNILLYEAWNERNTRSTSLTQKYVYLNSADLVSVEWPRGYYSSWRIVKLTNDGVVIKVDLVPADPELYSGEIVGTTPDGGQTVDDPPTPTNTTPLDIPILRDADNDAGEYVAMDGYGSNWPGGVLLKGDDDVNMTDEGTVTVGAPQGFAEGVLANWQANIIDFVNKVTVQMVGADDTLASVTRDEMLDGDANLFAFGVEGRWELCQAQTVVSLGSGRFTLSDWLRGQRGTEQYAATHAVGDRIVYLSPTGAGILRPDFDLGELNSAIYYKGVTLGDNPDNVTAITAVNTGVGLKPFNPVNLRASRDGSNTTITWDRRTRLIVDSFADGTDIPLGEASEQYRVVFYTSNTFATIASVQTVYSPSVTDTGVGTKYVDIAQVSALTGPGYYTRATL